MRRNDEEFYAEIMRRCDEYRIRRKARLKTAVCSLSLFLCLGAAVWYGASNAFEDKTEDIASSGELRVVSNCRAENDFEQESSAENNSVYDDAPKSFSDESAADGDNMYGESIEKTVKIVVRTEPENSILDRLYTDPEKIAQITSLVSSVTVESAPLTSDTGTDYIITLTDSQGRERIYTYSAETPLAKELAEKLSSLPSD